MANGARHDGENSHTCDRRRVPRCVHAHVREKALLESVKSRTREMNEVRFSPSNADTSGRWHTLHVRCNAAARTALFLNILPIRIIRVIVRLQSSATIIFRYFNLITCNVLLRLQASKYKLNQLLQMQKIYRIIYYFDFFNVSKGELCLIHYWPEAYQFVICPSVIDWLPSCLEKHTVSIVVRRCWTFKLTVYYCRICDLQILLAKNR